MLAFKIGKKAEFVDNVAHQSNRHVEIHNTFWGAWKLIGLFRSAARPLRAQIVTDVLCSGRGRGLKYWAWNEVNHSSKTWINYPLGWGKLKANDNFERLYSKLMIILSKDRLCASEPGCIFRTLTHILGLPRCKNLTRFSLFVSFCFAVRYCLKCFCFLCFTSSVSFTGSYTEVKPLFSGRSSAWVSKSLGVLAYDRGLWRKAA